MINIAKRYGAQASKSRWIFALREQKNDSLINMICPIRVHITIRDKIHVEFSKMSHCFENNLWIFMWMAGPGFCNNTNSINYNTNFHMMHITLFIDQRKRPYSTNICTRITIWIIEQLIELHHMLLHQL